MVLSSCFVSVLDHVTRIRPFICTGAMYFVSVYLCQP